MVDETVVAHNVYPAVLQWCVYQVENSVHISYLHLKRNCKHRQQRHRITNI